MPGKSLTIRKPIPDYMTTVASYSGGALVLAAYSPHIHKLYVRLGLGEYDEVGSTGHPLPDDASRLAFVRDRVAKLHTKRRAEREALRERLATVDHELAVYERDPTPDPKA